MVEPSNRRWGARGGAPDSVTSIESQVGCSSGAGAKVSLVRKKEVGVEEGFNQGRMQVEENLSAMNTDPWYSAYHYSHPPLVERLAAIEEADSKKEN
ncbi:hypothetical protein BHE74_00033094 [Ensete ventricosum]|nr:hypothetical protein BHE74_00033094 [Ensete ventricosum]RZS16738.1 hypothetical protein BHM03_00048765 [Ensete ventricosum]